MQRFYAFFGIFLYILPIFSLICSSKSCFPCSFSQFFDEVSGKCVEKSQFPSKTRVIISNRVTNTTKTLENPEEIAIYSDFALALQAEESKIATFASSELRFSFTNGTHVANPLTFQDEISIAWSFFRRSNVSLYFGPLFCEEMALDGCFPKKSVENWENMRPNVIFQGISVRFFVVFRLSLENLAFSFENYGENAWFLNSEPFFDALEPISPEILVKNAHFQGKYQKTSLFFLQLAGFGAKVVISHTNFEGFGGFCMMNFESSEETRSVSLDFVVIFANLRVFSTQMPDFWGGSPNFWLRLAGFQGFFLAESLVFKEIAVETLVFLENCGGNQEISGIFLENVGNFSLLKAKNSSIFVKNVSFSAISLNTSLISLETGSILWLNSLTVLGNSRISSENLLFSLDSVAILAFCSLFSLSIPIFLAESSIISLQNSDFLMISSADVLFFLEFSDFSIKSCTFSRISAQTSVFFLYGGVSSIKSSDFSAISGAAFLSLRKHASQRISSCFFANFSEIANFWGFNSEISRLHVETTDFLDCAIRSFLFVISSAISLNFSRVELRNVTGLAPNIFFAVLTASVVVFQRCRFENIGFFKETSHIFEMDFSLVFVEDCEFLDVGWVEWEVPRFLSSEDNNLLYCWAHQGTFISNSRFSSTKVSLFSGFLLVSVSKDPVFLVNNTFFVGENAENAGIYAGNTRFRQGIVINDAETVVLEGNTFVGLRCSRVSVAGLRKFDAPVSFNGESGDFLKKNRKSLTISNNSFADCRCEDGKSGFFAINYAKVEFSAVFFGNSSAKLGGSALCLRGIALLRAFSLKIRGFAGLSAIIRLERVISAAFLECVFTALNSTAISLRNSRLFIANRLFFKDLAGQQGPALDSDGGEIAISWTFVEKSQAEGAGGALYFSGRGRSRVFSCVFVESSGKDGGVVFANGEILLEIANFTVFLAKALAGSAVFVNEIREFSAENVAIFLCETLFQGTLLLRSKGEMLVKSLDGVKCVGNRAEIGACVDFEAGNPLFLSNFHAEDNKNAVLAFSWTNSLGISVENACFVANVARKALISVENVALFGKNLSFYDNFVDELAESEHFSLFLFESASFEDSRLENVRIFSNDTRKFDRNLRFSLFYQSFSKLCLRNLTISVFSESPNTDFFLIYAEGSSNFLRISQSFFEKTPGKSSKNQGFVLFWGGTLEVSQVFFKEIGDIPLVISAANVSLEHVIFQGNQGIASLLCNGDAQSPRIFVLQAKQAFFRAFAGVSLQIQDFSQALFEDVLFENADSSRKSLISALSLRETPNIQAKNCVFHGFFNEIGGAVQISSTKVANSLEISGILALFNEASTAGFLTVSGNFAIFVEKSVFFANRANICGVLLFQTANFQAKAALRLENNVFSLNFAENSFAIACSQAPIHETLNIFQANGASHGVQDAIFGFPEIIEIKEIPQQITSGEPFDLSFELRDLFQRRIPEDFDASGSLTVDVFSRKSPRNIRFINNFAVSSKNLLNFSSLIVYSPSGVLLNLNFKVSFVDLFAKLSKQSLKYITLNVSFPLKVAKCEIGQVLTRNLTCYACPPGYYSLEKPITTRICKKCLENARCEAGFLIIPQPGYWIFSNASEFIVECPKASHCVNSFDNSTRNLTKCRRGTTGNLCFYCNEGFSVALDGGCAQCQGLDVPCLMNLLVFLLVVMVFIIGNTAFLQQKSGKSQNSRNKTAIIVKIFINYLHNGALILVCNRTFLIKPLTDLVERFRSLAFLDKSFLACQCLLPETLENSSQYFLFKNIVIILLPLAFWALSFLYFVVVRLITRKILRKTVSSRKNLMETNAICLVIAIYMMYPLITKSSLAFFNCLKLSDKIPGTFLSIHPDVTCWEHTHIGFLLFLSFPPLLVWSLLFPLFIFANGVKQIILVETVKEEIEKKKRFFENQEFFCGLKEIKHLRNYRNNKILSFFMGNYKTKFCFWDSFIFFRKFFVTFVVSLCSSISQETAAMALLGILYLGMCGTFIFKPFKFTVCNNYEIMSLLCNAITVITTTLISCEIGEMFKIFILIACILGNFLVILFCFVETFQFFVRKVKEVWESLLGYWNFVNKTKRTRKNIVTNFI